MNEDYSPIQDTTYGTNAISSVLQKVFLMMTAGLVVTGIASYIVLHSTDMLKFVLNSYYVWIIAEFVLVITLSALLKKIGSGTATLMFFIYAIVNGITLSVVFLAYTETSITSTFLITASVFGAAALYGKVTKKNLSTFGSYLFMALWGLIIAGIVNIFILNSTLSFIISIVGIAIFIGITAYDVYKIKEMSKLMDINDTETANKLVTIGALSLYLDFINIFLKLLSIMGKRRN